MEVTVKTRTFFGEYAFTNYGYDPEHYAGVNLYYAQELAAGRILSYTITMGE